MAFRRERKEKPQMIVCGEDGKEIDKQMLQMPCYSDTSFLFKHLFLKPLSDTYMDMGMGL